MHICDVQFNREPIFLILIRELISPIDELLDIGVDLGFGHLRDERLDLSGFLFLFYDDLDLH